MLPILKLAFFACVLDTHNIKVMSEAIDSNAFPNKCGVFVSVLK